MKDYLQEITNSYLERRKENQKEDFRNYVKKELETSSYKVEINNIKKHNNIIIGDIKNAKIILSAHYDTPAWAIFPNLMLPNNKVLAYTYQLGLPILLALISLLISYLLKTILVLDYSYLIIFFLIIYYCSFFLLFRTFNNKNNFNDNTSGVVAILELASSLNNPDIAFILFDNEELGKKGSKALFETNKDLFNEKLLYNLDCVGNGNNFIFIANKGINNLELYEKVKQIKVNEKYNILFKNDLEASSNSDHKNFPLGVGIVACKQRKNVYYTPNIHTNKDTVCNRENIEFIVNYFKKYFEII